MINYLNDEDHEAQKILFTGLDTAGKTSIIMALQREFSKIAILSPTRGAQRRIFEFLGKNISEWDLGGQKSYRISYLKNPNKYFDNTEILIYVIDIQDKDRKNESLSYLKDVMKKLDELEIAPPIYIFFHKFDPVLSKSAYSEYSDLIVNLKQEIKNSIDHEELYFYNTSVYEFPTLIKAMSEILLSLYPKADLIDKTITEFARKVKSDGVAILDDNSLLIGSYYKNEFTKNILNASMPYFLTLHDSFHVVDKNLTANERIKNHVMVQRDGRYFIFKQIFLHEDIPPYYLLLVKEKPDFDKGDINSLSNLLRELLYK
ncbi:MAG: hypothetical protein GF317_24240 [Candidatus Lokiarchaeota archaeon]|nr:hypothetical protein [Candidatus Lokiarchaeota archaeon]MBD3202484.1 hypothetical protein [Candidatus Lokiarchaeota archaeon]